MTFFSDSEPWLREKQEALDFQDLQGLWRIQWKVGGLQLFLGSYTRIDQVFIIWSLICLFIFSIAQFFPISWQTQAIFWSVLALVGTVSMLALTWLWVRIERLCWLVYSWMILMLLGLALTDAGVFFGWAIILVNLCPLWLGLSGLGYLLTAWGVRSRTFTVNAAIHFGAIAILPYCAGWQFLVTGIVMATTLMLLASLQWDMRSPIDYDLLTSDQREFNRQQHQKRLLTLENEL